MKSTLFVDEKSLMRQNPDDSHTTVIGTSTKSDFDEWCATLSEKNITFQILS